MKNIYTPKEAAFEMIMERRENLALREKVVQYLGERLFAACFFADTPPAFLARYVPRATDEDRLFADEAREAGFTPYWSSYLADRYTVRNPEKVQTIRPPIRWAKGQRTRQWVVAPEERSGGIGELNTIFGYIPYREGMGETGLEFLDSDTAELVRTLGSKAAASDRIGGV